MTKFTSKLGVVAIVPHITDETKAIINDWCNYLHELEKREKRNLIIRHIIFSVIGGLIGYMVVK